MVSHPAACSFPALEGTKCRMTQGHLSCLFASHASTFKMLPLRGLQLQLSGRLHLTTCQGSSLCSTAVQQPCTRLYAPHTAACFSKTFFIHLCPLCTGCNQKLEDCNHENCPPYFFVMLIILNGRSSVRTPGSPCSLSRFCTLIQKHLKNPSPPAMMFVTSLPPPQQPLPLRWSSR